jgi:hypothetical protein
MNNIKKNIIFFILISIIFTSIFSCKNEKEQPKVIYNKSSKNEETKIDSTQIKIADLPILMEGTDYLLHPIGGVNVYEGRAKSSYGSASTNYVSYSVSNYNRFELTGNLQNILFQHKDKDSLIALTSKKINILTATYLYNNSIKNKTKIIVYTLIDQDTNKDILINQNDIKSLYISKIDGTGFQKITQDFHELIDWNILESKNRLYYRAIDDTNRNGKFDKNDKVHYYYLDLNDLTFKSIEYFPI